MLAQAPQAGLGIDLGRAEVLVSEEFLHLVYGHPRVQQQGGHARPEPVRRVRREAQRQNGGTEVTPVLPLLILSEYEPKAVALTGCQVSVK
jgi:hypothetical protein